MRLTIRDARFRKLPMSGAQECRIDVHAVVMAWLEVLHKVPATAHTAAADVEHLVRGLESLRDEVLELQRSNLLPKTPDSPAVGARTQSVAQVRQHGRLTIHSAPRRIRGSRSLSNGL